MIAWLAGLRTDWGEAYGVAWFDLLCLVVGVVAYCAVLVLVWRWA